MLIRNVPLATRRCCVVVVVVVVVAVVVVVVVCVLLVVVVVDKERPCCVFVLGCSGFVFTINVLTGLVVTNMLLN